ncbi:hypothetical protein [Mesorhizobium sp.]|uniref:hypothetical protein n=1 Tax=Mesorhizobium sp. TaxID=1871066 RepID=UPI000FE39259|nr:hypothetical protein [Mesorhizobium sp.]RWB95196.1 MAG: hypothetical protein EOQ56_28635 [Mesorhizobium sp.]RWP16614.1 MAG: hypothetical protein EOR00_16740 [Mesorhizobium sp.]RWP29530.1 MAG: hypothetical protein EOR02_15755 [Mesorhizobium sp.]RWP59561.1 MAG: hypothetical protein EOR07_27115 [Mesorhizobium sp.]RWQ13224.1 MAG: hypothetical protein EOR92_30675 [Mesorhizobium sp.]
MQVPEPGVASKTDACQTSRYQRKKLEMLFARLPPSPGHRLWVDLARVLALVGDRGGWGIDPAQNVIRDAARDLPLAHDDQVGAELLLRSPDAPWLRNHQTCRAVFPPRGFPNTTLPHPRKRH